VPVLNRLRGQFPATAALAVCLAVAVFTGLRRTFASDASALATSVTDDTYYYFLPALRFWDTGFFTFDGTRATYGFQPLWEVVLTLWAGVISARQSFLRSTLLITHLLRAATGVFLYLALAHAPGARTPAAARVAGAITAIAWLSHLPFLWAGTQGKENALLAFLFAVSLFLIARGYRIAAAGTLGLSLLTRVSPAAFALVAVLAIPLFEQSTARKRGAILGALLLPWLVWGTYAHFALGRVLPSSGAIKLATFWQLWRTPGGLESAAPELLVLVAGYLHQAIRFSAGISSSFAKTLGGWGALRVAAVLVAAGWLFSRRRFLDGTERLWAASAVVVLAATACVPVLLIGRRLELFYFSWYLTELPLLLCVLVALPFRKLSVEKQPWALLPLAALAMVPVPGQLPRLDGASQEGGPFQRAMAEAAVAVSQLPSSVTVAARDTGLLGFLLERPIVNLDGLANDEILEAQRTRMTLEQYARSRGITHVLGPLTEGRLFGAPFSGYEVVRRFDFDFPSKGDGYYLVKLTSVSFPEAKVVLRGPAASSRFHPRSATPVLGRSDRVIFLHPAVEGPTEVVFELNGAYETFEARAGVTGRGEVGLQLFLDGKAAGEWVLKEGTAAVDLSISLKGVHRVRISVDTGSDGGDFDWFHLSGVRFHTSAPIENHNADLAGEPVQ